MKLMNEDYETLKAYFLLRNNIDTRRMYEELGIPRTDYCWDILPWKALTFVRNLRHTYSERPDVMDALLQIYDETSDKTV